MVVGAVWRVGCSVQVQVQVQVGCGLSVFYIAIYTNVVYTMINVEFSL